MVKIKTQYFKDGSVVSEVENDLPMLEAREQREFNLTVTDILVIPDRFEQLSSSEQTELKAIRQKWRDIPQDANNQDANIVFPTIPSWLKAKFPELNDYE